MLDRDELVREASEAGFQPESFEKVLRLFDLLQAMRSHPFLRPRMALKGGTALNLFVFDVPRLSVDVDVNYVGSADRATMVADRSKVDQAVNAVCGRLGIQVHRVPSEHAGGKWRLSYQGAFGRPATLELDVNYMLRTPLWPVQALSSRKVAGSSVSDFPVVDVHELAAGKLAALLSRQASRDLFDVHRLLNEASLDRLRLRQAFVVYGGCNRRDWRGVRVEDVRMTVQEAKQQLVPLLSRAERPPEREMKSWTSRMVDQCRERLAAVLPMTERELEFLTRLNDRGEIAAGLLTDEPGLRATIDGHPMLLWKAQNVREYRRQQP